MEQLEVNGLARYNEDTDSLDVYYTDGELAGSIYCGFQYPIGEETNFIYNDTVQEFKVPASGLWKLEVWGAQGGNANASGNGTYTENGGLGGYSIGYIELYKDDLLYICVGGCGGTASTSSSAGASASGGYNGGSASNVNSSSYTFFAAGGGGGATHIAKVSGELKDIGYDKFVSNKYGLIVAGGGGGAVAESYPEAWAQFAYPGGTGGGVNGGSATGNNGTANGGTQTSGGGFGIGETATASMRAGAGAGLYGGHQGTDGGPGAGGSGYIDGVPSIMFKNELYSPTSENGVNSGNGKAKLTFIGR